MKATYIEVAEILRVLGHPLRIAIIKLLEASGSQGRSVTEIGSYFKIKQGAASAHLLLMKRLKILTSEKQGRQVNYSIANPKIITAVKSVIEVLED